MRPRGRKGHPLPRVYRWSLASAPVLTEMESMALQPERHYLGVVPREGVQVKPEGELEGPRIP